MRIRPSIRASKSTHRPSWVATKCRQSGLHEPAFRAVRTYFHNHLDEFLGAGRYELRQYPEQQGYDFLDRFDHPGQRECSVEPMGDSRVAMHFHVERSKFGYEDIEIANTNFINVLQALTEARIQFVEDRLGLVEQHLVQPLGDALAAELPPVSAGFTRLEWNVAPIFPIVERNSGGTFSKLRINAHLLRLTIDLFDPVPSAERAIRDDAIQQAANEVRAKFFGLGPYRPSSPEQGAFLEKLEFAGRIFQKLPWFLKQIEVE